MAFNVGDTVIVNIIDQDHSSYTCVERHGQRAKILEFGSYHHRGDGQVMKIGFTDGKWGYIHVMNLVKGMPCPMEAT